MFDIGNTLREARLRRGLDIADCESATKIRAKYLRALEEEQFEVLPGPTYVKGFLRTYAEHLELDGRLVIEEYDSRFGGRNEAYVADGEASRKRSRRRRNREARVLAVMSLLVLLTATGLWVGFADDQTSSTPTTSTGNSQSSGSVPARAITAVFALRNGAPTTIEIRQENATGTVLIARRALDAGARLEVPARPPIWVETGAPARLRITIDGRDVDPPTSSRFRILEQGVLDPQAAP